MVIQNNIPGLNSKRNYNKNSSKLAKSLEKLSSGYAINRAADDAAGLAVSEKMRSQICGMKQSVKNCQDGISLIQTFEGALGETVTIIKRMKSLADQSANGTYDDNVDRNAIEIEYLHLCDEVNHIAETDFNGVVMLNGKPDSAARAAELERAVNSAVKESLNSLSPASSYADVPQTVSVSDVSVQAAAFAAPRAGGTACGDFTVYGDSSDFSFNTATGVLTILGGNVTVEGTGVPTTNTIVVAKDKSANVTLKNVNVDVSSMRRVCAFKIEDNSNGDVTITLDGNNTLKSGELCAGLQKNSDVNNGTLTIKGSGFLNTYGGLNGAGIGGGDRGNGSNIIINSGTVNANGGNSGAGIGGGAFGEGTNITINGGNVTANGDETGAGIGGGAKRAGTYITINGGIVTANGDASGAGIGGGDYGAGMNITINGGIVTANGGSVANNCGGAGIGGGSNGDGFNIIINGGIVNANGGEEYGAGIGGGDKGTGTIITISNGTVTAIGGAFGAGIGGGSHMAGTDITICGGIVTAVGGKDGAGIGGGIYNNGENIIISGGTVIAKGGNSYNLNKGGGAGIGGGYRCGFNNDITIKNKGTVVIAKGGSDADDFGSGWPFVDSTFNPIKIDIILTKEPYNGNGIIDGTIVHYKGATLDPPEPPNNPDPPDTPNDPDVPEKIIVSIPNAFGNATAKLTYIDDLTLQVGARTKDAVNFTFAYSSNGIGGLAADLNCTARGLGINTLTLKTQESANFAIDKLDYALNKVSMIRATFGAAQNRLEHKIDNLNNTTENLTAAESAIRDTDMAKEMMNFTKNQILTQASQSMFAQANSLPQQVMSLISS